MHINIHSKFLAIKKLKNLLIFFIITNDIITNDNTNILNTFNSNYYFFKIIYFVLKLTKILTQKMIKEHMVKLVY